MKQLSGHGTQISRFDNQFEFFNFLTSMSHEFYNLSKGESELDWKEMTSPEIKDLIRSYGIDEDTAKIATAEFMQNQYGGIVSNSKYTNENSLTVIGWNHIGVWYGRVFFKDEDRQPNPNEGTTASA